MLFFQESHHYCEPLTSNRSLADCLVGGMTFREAQLRQFDSVGEKVPYQMRENLWLNLTEWEESVRDGLALMYEGELVAGPSHSWEGLESLKRKEIELSRVILYPWDLLAVNDEILEDLESKSRGEMHPMSNVEGILHLGKGSVVLAGVCIEGNVSIGKNCKIGPNAYIRGNTTIGDDCWVGHGVEIKDSIVMSGSQLGHLSYVGDSLLGESVVLGAGTMTANYRHDEGEHYSAVEGVLCGTGRESLGAIIGDGVRTGVNTSLYPARKIWPGLTTAPGEVVSRDLQY